MLALVKEMAWMTKYVHHNTHNVQTACSFSNFNGDSPLATGAK